MTSVQERHAVASEHVFAFAAALASASSDIGISISIELTSALALASSRLQNRGYFMVSGACKQWLPPFSAMRVLSSAWMVVSTQCPRHASKWLTHLAGKSKRRHLLFWRNSIFFCVDGSLHAVSCNHGW